jgi:hypothetical protein
MSPRIVVAQCGRDKSLTIIEEGKHLAEAVYMENQPEGSGWFIPPWCPECEEKFIQRATDPARRAEIDAYLTGPEFQKVTNDVAGYAAYRRIMQQE